MTKQPKPTDITMTVADDGTVYATCNLPRASDLLDAIQRRDADLTACTIVGMIDDMFPLIDDDTTTDEFVSELIEYLHNYTG